MNWTNGVKKLFELGQKGDSKKGNKKVIEIQDKQLMISLALTYASKKLVKKENIAMIPEQIRE